MEFQQVFVTFAVILVATIGILGFTTYLNTSYNTNVTAGFNTTTQHIQSINTAVIGIGTNTANSTITNSGTGTGSTSADLVNRGLGVITQLPTMLGIAPSLMSDAANMLDIPTTYVNIAIVVFFFGFALLMAYMLIVGVRRIM